MYSMSKLVYHLWISTGTYQVSMPRTILYCRRYEDTYSLYQYFRVGLKLEGGFVEPSDAPDLSRFSLVELLQSGDDVKGQ